MAEGKLEFGTEQLSETARRPFAGKIVEANFPCQCELCKKGDARLKGEKGETSGDQVHLFVDPVDDVYDKQQNIWMIPRSSEKSKWGRFNQALEELGLADEMNEEGLEFLKNKVFRFEDEEIEVGLGSRTVHLWVPVELVEQDSSGSVVPDLA